MSKLSRTKGHNFEREIAERLRQIPGVTAKRCLIETQQGNQGDIITNLSLSIQCKVGAVPPIYPAIDQAVEAARPGQIPVAVIRRNARAGKKYDLVVLRLEDFLTTFAPTLTPAPVEQHDLFA